MSDFAGIATFIEERKGLRTAPDLPLLVIRKRGRLAHRWGKNRMKTWGLRGLKD